MEETKQLTDNDGLINIFMGLPDEVDRVKLQGGTEKVKFRPMKYSQSWNDLMPVIERIEKIQGVVTVMKNRRFQITYGKKKFSCHTVVKINSAYRVVVEFLDWYSNQPQKAS